MLTATKSRTSQPRRTRRTIATKTRRASRLIKLDEAARRLGCHIETLRLRIRSGRLTAYRGPHGAYYIGIESLIGLLAHKRDALPVPTERDLELAWRKSRLRVGEELGRVRIEEASRRALIQEIYEANLIRRSFAIHRLGQLPREYRMVVTFLQALKTNPTIQPGVFRLLLGQGLGTLGFRAKQVASVLAISERQARRLVHKREIASAVFRAAHRWAPREARRLVIELRTQLEAEGVRFHRRTRSRWPPLHPERPRPAFIQTTLTQDEVIGLKRAGLSDEQVWAITVVGMGSDELNQLLLRGAK